MPALRRMSIFRLMSLVTRQVPQPNFTRSTNSPTLSIASSNWAVNIPGSMTIVSPRCRGLDSRCGRRSWVSITAASSHPPCAQPDRLGEDGRLTSTRMDRCVGPRAALSGGYQPECAATEELDRQPRHRDDGDAGGDRRPECGL